MRTRAIIVMLGLAMLPVLLVACGNPQVYPGVTRPTFPGPITILTSHPGDR